MQPTIRSAICTIICLAATTVAFGQEAQSLVLRIKAVGREGVGNVEAAKALKQLVALGPGAMPEVLAGMDDASPVATNWLRAAIEAMQDKGVQSGQKIPVAKIEAFLADKSHNGRARRLAYECLVRNDAKTPERLLPTMLDDPSSELRRDAVARKLASFGKSPTRKQLEELLAHARDQDQINAIAKNLKDQHGVKIDLTKQFGFITRWNVIGPFDNAKGVGFNVPYPPEKGIDFKATYPAKGNKQVNWQEHTTTKDLGLVDFNEAVGKLKGVVQYAYTAVESETERPVEIRAASNNAIRIWLNGKEIFFREEYHHGMEIDQHVGKGTLRKGKNEILIKVCQNEQTETWAEQWSFRLRICDALGGAVPLSNVTEKVK
ncbi:MAG TPA: HEAT repeat domain-containing protein [Gemmataceae bacterium]|nr:HEAT repeat domain-containing protein [Gemmataceae bacterium]